MSQRNIPLPPRHSFLLDEWRVRGLIVWNEQHPIGMAEYEGFLVIGFDCPDCLAFAEPHNALMELLAGQEIICGVSHPDE